VAGFTPAFRFLLIERLLPIPGIAELGTSTQGGVLTVSGNLTAEVVDNWDTDARSLHGPEDGWRLEETHNLASPSNILQWTVPATKVNVSNFTHLSFRIGQGNGALSPAWERPCAAAVSRRTGPSSTCGRSAFRSPPSAAL